MYIHRKENKSQKLSKDMKKHESVWKAMQEFEPVHIDYKFLDRKEKFIKLI